MKTFLLLPLAAALFAGRLRRKSLARRRPRPSMRFHNVVDAPLNYVDAVVQAQETRRKRH